MKETEPDRDTQTDRRKERKKSEKTTEREKKSPAGRDRGSWREIDTDVYIQADVYRPVETQEKNTSREADEKVNRKENNKRRCDEDFSIRKKHPVSFPVLLVFSRESSGRNKRGRGDRDNNCMRVNEGMNTYMQRDLHTLVCVEDRRRGTKSREGVGKERERKREEERR